MARDRRINRPQEHSQLFDWLALAMAFITILAIISDARIATITP
jgi:hypothetical protein